MLAGSVSVLVAVTPPASLLAYVGIGPGQEFIPYFLALLGFVGVALLAVIQWPALVLLRLIARLRGRTAESGRAALVESAAAHEPEAAGADVPGGA